MYIKHHLFHVNIDIMHHFELSLREYCLNVVFLFYFFGSSLSVREVMAHHKTKQNEFFFLQN